MNNIHNYDHYQRVYLSITMYIIRGYFFLSDGIIPICSMCGIFTYIWVIFRANVGKYSIHGAYGYGKSTILGGKS